MWKIDKCSLNCCPFFPCIVHIYQNQLNIYRNNVHHQIKFAPAKITHKFICELLRIQFHLFPLDQNIVELFSCFEP